MEERITRYMAIFFMTLVFVVFVSASIVAVDILLNQSKAAINWEVGCLHDVLDSHADLEKCPLRG